MEGLFEELERLAEDRRIGPVHVAVYVALCWCGEEGQIAVRRDEIMRRARIQGRTTYYKTMKELSKWGYIEYDGRKKLARLNLDLLD